MLGVFDSGIGGLGVVRKIFDSPCFDGEIFYLADIANAPFGNKNKIDLTKIVLDNIKILQQNNCNEIILACNSVSVLKVKNYIDKNCNILTDYNSDKICNSDKDCDGKNKILVDTNKQLIDDEIFLNEENETFSHKVKGIFLNNSDINLKDNILFEMINPVLNYCCNQKYKNILLCATPATIASDVYRQDFLYKNITITNLAFPNLATMIDNGVDDIKVEEYIFEILNTSEIDYDNFNAVILGCTHYPVVKNIFEKYFNKYSNIIEIIDPAYNVSEEYVKYKYKNSKKDINIRDSKKDNDNDDNNVIKDSCLIDNTFCNNKKFCKLKVKLTQNNSFIKNYIIKHFADIDVEFV